MMDKKVLEALNMLYKGTAKSVDEKQSAYVTIVMALEAKESNENGKDTD